MAQVISLLVALIIAVGLGYFVGFEQGTDVVSLEKEQGSLPAISSAAATMGSLIGTWQSIDDPKFTRAFLNDGSVIDLYDGDEKTVGSWLVFTKDIPDTLFKGELENHAVYLSIIMSENERLYFKVASIDATSLQLAYIDRGGMLTFSRE